MSDQPAYKTFDVVVKSHSLGWNLFLVQEKDKESFYNVGYNTNAGELHIDAWGSDNPAQLDATYTSVQFAEKKRLELDAEWFNQALPDPNIDMQAHDFTLIRLMAGQPNDEGHRTGPNITRLYSRDPALTLEDKLIAYQSQVHAFYHNPVMQELMDTVPSIVAGQSETMKPVRFNHRGLDQ